MLRRLGPARRRVDLVLRRRTGDRRLPMARGQRRRLVAGVDEAGTAPTTRSASTGAPLPDPRSALAAARRARPEPGLRPGALRAGTTRAGPGASAARRGRLRAARRHVHARGDARRGPRAARPPRRARRRPGRADAGRARSPGAGAGGTTAPTRTPCTSRTAAPTALQRFVDACHAGPRRSASTSSTTTSARRQLPAPSSARTSPTSTRRRGARRSTSTARARDEVRRWIVDNALRWFRDFHVDALRLDAVHALRRRLAPAPARPAGRRDRRSWPARWAARWR